jgi:hypothetical protein
MQNLFSIRVDSLRIAGGILLFSIAFDMMYAKIPGERITEEEISQRDLSVERTRRYLDLSDSSSTSGWARYNQYSSSFNGWSTNY